MMDIRYYDVIVSPVITEKATMISEKSQVIFNVVLKVKKAEVKAAVEELFGVKVKAVNILVRKGKERRFKGTVGRQSNLKRAIVTLEKGQFIDFSSGL